MHVTQGTSADDVLAMVDHAAKLGAKVLVLPEYALIGSWAPTAEEAAKAADNAAADLAQGFGDRQALQMRDRALDRRRASGGRLLRDHRAHRSRRRRDRPLSQDPSHRRGTRLGDRRRHYPVFDTPFGRIGIMAGYDALFPETSRCLAAAAADIILWPASMRDPFERELIAVPRAADNRVALVVANRLDSPYPGGSLVIPPTGFRTVGHQRGGAALARAWAR